MSIALDIHVKEKRHGARAILGDIRLQLQEAEVVSLIGASGCGKSSLLAIASGLDRNFSGAIKQLSGGQAQRAAIARGLFTQPRVLLDGGLTEFLPGPAPRKRGDADAAHLKAEILASLHV